ncbi:copper amine oxidase N-terminal domain-containing protein [Paenibacillus aceris]|uniref:Copper amine oxidase-like N-terminal domain-containing protein n=1 Tax=Paenibacillus aceris TaxID=869555 RepID=A0ABS4I3H9_9BACL|nr:copper amine oxidase N-terminal domain-containing protein [Paenibacillus aceris]MBP1965459.1 hypothetical protein [Paenibacillus aceris]NHW33491.1 copper amine oxidase N-terminal domain-containing protein [Paenibacillus aceris]
MKSIARKTTFILALLLLFIIPNVHAESSSPAIAVFLNEEQITFDQDPLLVDGNTLVPFRTIFEKLGYSVTWEEKKQGVSAQRESNEIHMTIGSSLASVNQISYILDASPQIRDGVTLVPLRFVAEASGAAVTWDQEKHQIDMMMDKNEAPEQKINRLIKGYASSKSAHDFISAITRSTGTKNNGYEVKGITFDEKGKEGMVEYTLDYWVNQPKLINSSATSKESMNISIEIKQKVYADEDGNWHLSPILRDREYLVVPK